MGFQAKPERSPEPAVPSGEVRKVPKEVLLWLQLKRKLLEDAKKSPPDPKALELLLWMVEEEMR